MRNLILRFVLLALFSALLGCSHTVHRPLPADLRVERDPLRTPQGVEIRGYATSDGVVHPFVGRARMKGDSLQFRSREDEPAWDSVARRPTGDPELRWVSPPPNVVGLREARFSLWRTGLFAMSPALLYATVFLLAAAHGWD